MKQNILGRSLSAIFALRFRAFGIVSPVFYYAHNSEEVEGAYCFGVVRASVRLSVCPSCFLMHAILDCWPDMLDLPPPGEFSRHTLS